MEKCTSRLGHKFEPRYDTLNTLRPINEVMSSTKYHIRTFENNLEDVTKALRETRQLHVCDVCVRCGAVAAVRNLKGA